MFSPQIYPIAKGLGYISLAVTDLDAATENAAAASAALIKKRFIALLLASNF